MDKYKNVTSKLEDKLDDDQMEKIRLINQIDVRFFLNLDFWIHFLIGAEESAGY